MLYNFQKVLLAVEEALQAVRQTVSANTAVLKLL